MRSALGEPPLSGLRRSADAGPARASRATIAAAISVRRRGFRRKARRILWVRLRERALGAAELGAAFLDERRDAFDEVARGGHLLLDVGLELELGVHPVIEPGVELALG